MYNNNALINPHNLSLFPDNVAQISASWYQHIWSYNEQFGEFKKEIDCSNSCYHEELILEYLYFNA
jgi:hypothetical protein